MDLTKYKHVVLTRTLKPLQNLSQNFPAVYIALIGLLGLGGYIGLLAFPAMIIIGLQHIFAILFTGSSTGVERWIGIANWAVLTLISLLVVYRYGLVRFRLPAGIELGRDKAPPLYALIDELRETYRWVPIDRIIMTDRFELDIVRTPRYVVPFWHTHTLKIGLPVMQCLTTDNVNCLLARKLGQFSRRQNVIPNWLYQLRHDWEAHHRTFLDNASFGILPLSLFFRCYAPLYRLASTYIARIDELRADDAALRIINDEEVLDTIEKWLTAGQFLEKGYWPNARRIIAKNPNGNPNPFEKLHAACRHFEQKQDRFALVGQLFDLDPPIDDPQPALIARVENIGHTRIIPPSQTLKPAAQALLHPNYGRIIAVVNKLWLKQTANEWKQTAIELQNDRVTFNSLYLKAKKQRLSYREIWQYARLQKRLFGKKSAFPLQNYILRRTPELVSAR